MTQKPCNEDSTPNPYHVCSKCNEPKPLTIKHWLPRKESRTGFRGVCRVCWYAQQQPNKRAHYRRHCQRIKAERRARRRADPVHSRLIDMRYRLRHPGRLRARQQRYYAANREHLIEYAIARRKRLRSLDYGWQSDLKHDRAPFELWQSQQAAANVVDNLLSVLPDHDVQFLMLLMKTNFDYEMAAVVAGLNAATTMARVRRVAKGIAG